MKGREGETGREPGKRESGIGRQRGSRATRPISLALAILVALGTVAGCGYSLVGTSSTLSPSIKAVQFETLLNQTSRVGVEQRLSREIARELASRGRFSVQSAAAGADAVLTGAVIGFDFYPVAFDEQGRAKEYQVRITARVSLKGTSDEKVIWENPSYSFQENYSFSTSAASYVDRENEAIDRVAERFAGSLVANLLEGF